MPEVFVPGDDGAEVWDVPEGPERVVHQLGLIDLADHDGVVDAEVAEDASPGADAEESDVAEGCAEGGEFGFVLLGEAEAVDGVSHFAEATGDHDRQLATACDEPDGGRGRGWIREDREGGGCRQGDRHAEVWSRLVCVAGFIPKAIDGQ